MTRHLHQELLNHLPDCDACGRNQHDYCTPIVQTTQTVCACFTAHPMSDAHENAMFWWSRNQLPDRPHTNWVCPSCGTGYEEPMWRCRECGWDDGSEGEPSIFEGNVTIGGFTTTACTSVNPHPEHPMGDGTTCLGIPQPERSEKEDTDPPGEPALDENGRTSEKD